MAVATLRPNADAVNAWTKSSGTTSFGVLDEVVTQPTNAETSGDGSHLSSSTSGQESEVHVGTFALNANVVSEATLWVFAKGGAKRAIDFRLLTGATELAVGARITATASAWHSVTYTGELTQAQIDDLRAEVICRQTAGGGGATAAFVYAAYIDVTHDAAAIVYNDSPSGALTASGSQSESHEHSSSPTGAVTASGALTESWSGVTVYDDTPVGAVAASGSLTELLSHAASVSGAVAVSGSLVESFEGGEPEPARRASWSMTGIGN